MDHYTIRFVHPSIRHWYLYCEGWVAGGGVQYSVHGTAMCNVPPVSPPPPLYTPLYTQYRCTLALLPPLSWRWWWRWLARPGARWLQTGKHETINIELVSLERDSWGYQQCGRPSIYLALDRCKLCTKSYFKSLVSHNYVYYWPRSIMNCLINVFYYKVQTMKNVEEIMNLSSLKQSVWILPRTHRSECLNWIFNQSQIIWSVSEFYPTLCFISTPRVINHSNHRG